MWVAWQLEGMGVSHFMDLRLLVLQGKPEGKEIPIRVPKFIIGRTAECHLRPNSELVSRQHCQFTIDGDVARVRDLGSSNGTIVNGERLTEEVVISDGDLIQVGPLAFQVILQKTAAADVAESADEAAVVAAAAAEPVHVDAPDAQQAAVPVPALAAAAPIAAQAGKLGSKEAKTADIDHWLMSDAKNKLPDSGSGVYTGDTQMIQVAELTGDTDPGVKSADEKTPPEGVKKPEEPGDTVQLADGRTIKVGSSKQVIEKTREDTSRAAADIIRRMMERRPGPAK